MRFLHLADLHFGKMLHGVSLLENGDQGDWVEKLLELVAQKRPDAVVVAGDVYDRGMPSGAAMQLLSTMVTGISELDVPVLIAAGNHDSGQRLDCFKDILSKQNVYISGVLRRELTHVTLTDAYGAVTFWLLPYVFPAAAAQALGDDAIHDYDTAVRRILAEQGVDFSRRNVIVAHQNVTKGGAEGVRGGSESVVGGVGQVDYTAFDGFDYAALGHIHAAYAVGRESVRYAGSPLCYHFDELRQSKKGPVLVELGEKGTEPKIETLTIPPLHPMRELRDTYDRLMAAASDCGRGEYIKLVLTDRAMTPEISAYFEAFFQTRGSVLMERTSEFRRFTGESGSPELRELERKSVEELFADFYTERAGGEPHEGDAALMRFAAELLRNSDAGADGKAVEPALAEKVLEFLAKEDA
ncbi:MAG: exonuclease SbcCD subunit D [Oscillospiraceae bacterium]|nr:exonuclease SbcCD subunit D [Oscillospiraceae bacterium]